MSLKIFYKIKSCRICKSKSIFNFFNLGNQPLANDFKKNKNLKIPLSLMYCNTCKTVQTNVNVNKKKLFSKYVWVTSTSSTALNFRKKFYRGIIKRNKIKNPFIVEIASNDGSFLYPFKQKGYEVLGVDPASNIVKLAKKKIKIENLFFNYKNSIKIKKKYSSPHIIFARNVIAHVDNINSVIKGIYHLLDNEGFAAIEFHYAKEIQNKLQYDSIYHEHIFYFTAITLCKIFKKYNLHPFDASHSPISGGALIIFFSKKKKTMSPRLKKIFLNEKKNKINSKLTWIKFKNRALKHSKELYKLLSKLSKKNDIIGYGASARSTTLINFSKINQNIMKFIIDKNRMKVGKFTPGTKIKIIKYKSNINSLKRKYILLLAWNFAKEIINDFKIKNFKGTIIQPLPNKIKIYDFK
jgi:ubiquinone/menaquinone biosynthesis C-methylase UbiE